MRIAARDRGGAVRRMPDSARCVFGFGRITGLLRLLQPPLQQIGDLPRQKWRHRVSNLHVGFGSVAKEQIVVRECLQPGRFPHGQTAALKRVRVDEVVAVLGDVAGDWVIPPFLTGCIRRTYAAIFSFCAGVMPPIPMFGRSLL